MLLDDPGFHCFAPMVRIVGAVPVPVPLLGDAGFRFSIEALRERVTSRTRLLLLCNPDNPTGRVRDRAELEAIAEAADEFDFLIMADEAYEHFTYDGRRHISMGALGDVGRRVITVQTVSKVYNMSGWRVGWVVANEEILKPILAVHSYGVCCPTSFAQAGAAAVLEESLGEGDLPITDLVHNYEKQRDAMVQTLNSIPGVKCATPEGGYCIFPDFNAFGMPSMELSTYLLETGAGRHDARLGLWRRRGGPPPDGLQRPGRGNRARRRANCRRPWHIGPSGHGVERSGGGVRRAMSPPTRCIFTNRLG